MATTDTLSSTSTIVGYFETNSDARQAVEALQDAGFTSAHIGLAHRGGSSATSANTSGSNAVSSVGAQTAGAWDKLKSFFGADSTDSDARSGAANDTANIFSAKVSSPVEPYADERSQGDFANREVTANPSESSPYGGYDEDSAYQGYGGSDLHHTLNGLSVPEDRSRYFGHRFNTGEQSAVVTVNAGSRAAEAEEILARYGADLGDSAAGYDYPETAVDGSANYTGAATKVADQNNIQLLGEVLRVHKDRVSRGDVRIRKEVITETQTVQVPVTREELVIERHAVTDQTASGSIGDTGEIRIPLSEERASIDKSTVVMEEVSVAKKQVEEVRDLSGQIRHEELVVEDETTKPVVN